MSKFVVDAALNASLQYIIDNCTAVHICSGDPTDLTETTTNSLANSAVVGGDWTLADGDTSGRKLTFGGKSAVTGTATGTGATACFVSGSALLLKTDISPTTSVSVGVALDIPAVDAFENADLA